MTCRHAPGDPNCSSHPSNVAMRQAEYEEEQRTLKKANDRIKELLSRTPNPDIYEIVQVKQVENNLVLMVQYSNCKKCSFDAKKVMVFTNTKLEDAILWKRIDPHFSDEPYENKKHAPAPRARFPADEQGWQDAIEYANSKK